MRGERVSKMKGDQTKLTRPLKWLARHHTIFNPHAVKNGQKNTLTN